VTPTGDAASLTVGGIFAANQAVGPAVVSLETFVATGGAELDQLTHELESQLEGAG